MANPYDFLKSLMPQNTNMFGASPSPTTQQMAEMGLLGKGNYQDILDNANRQSMFQGLLTTGLAYAAQPQNQGYGSVFPYLAKAGLQGVNAAQRPYDQMSKDAMTSYQLQQMKIAQDKQKASDNFLSTWGQPNTGEMKLDPNQQLNIAPERLATNQDYGVGSSLMGARSTPNTVNPVAPSYATRKTSLIDALDNDLLGADPQSTLEATNGLAKTYNGVFDENKAIDDAVASGALKLPEALKMKADIATLNAKSNEVQFGDPDKDVYLNGQKIKDGVPKAGYQILDEKGLQAYEMGTNNAINTLPRVDAKGQPITYQYNKDNNKIEVLKTGTNSITNTNTNTVGSDVDKFNTKDITKDLIKTRETALLARKSLPSIRGAYNLISTAQTGMLSEQINNLNRFRAKFNDFNEDEKADFEAKVDAAMVAGDTEELEVLLGREVFPLIKILGIGARGLDTPAERDFLIKMFTGTGTMTKQSLKRITAKRLKEAQQSINKYNQKLQDGAYTRMKENYLTATKATSVGDYYDPIDVGQIGNDYGSLNVYSGLESISKQGSKMYYLPLDKPVEETDANGFPIKRYYGWQTWEPV